MRLVTHISARFAGLVLALAVAALVATPASGQSAKPTPAPRADQQTFASPEEAVAALSTAVAATDRAALTKLFGPAIDEISSGDPVADKASFESFAKRMSKLTNIVKQGDAKAVLYIGAENWPFQFPIVRSNDKWFFDGKAGLDEMFNRRIGANELHTIRVCRVYVDAQKEYAASDHDGDGVLEYAQRLVSMPGNRDGLYWASDDENDASPFGPLVAYAGTEGYTVKQAPQPFHGYYFRILKAQGPAAPGRAYSYVINGNMIGGFAILAYPATWGNSGLMSFIVNQQGQVYQRDLGPNTAAVAAGMRAYNPDSSWKRVEDQ